MKITLTVVFVAALIWAAIAFALDRYALAPLWPWASELMTVKLQFKWPLGSFNLPRIGLLVLLGIPFLAVAICCVPRREIRSRASWLTGFHVWSRLMVWLLVWCVLILVGQVLYLGLQKVLPDGLCNIAEAFELQGAVKIFDFPLAHRRTKLIENNENKH